MFVLSFMLSCHINTNKIVLFLCSRFYKMLLFVLRISFIDLVCVWYYHVVIM